MKIPAMLPFPQDEIPFAVVLYVTQTKNAVQGLVIEPLEKVHFF
jgi:hypothetical protein